MTWGSISSHDKLLALQDPSSRNGAKSYEDSVWMSMWRGNKKWKIKIKKVAYAVLSPYEMHLSTYICIYCAAPSKLVFPPFLHEWSLTTSMCDVTLTWCKSTTGQSLQIPFRCSWWCLELLLPQGCLRKTNQNVASIQWYQFSGVCFKK